MVIRRTSHSATSSTRTTRTIHMTRRRNRCSLSSTGLCSTWSTSTMSRVFVWALSLMAALLPIREDHVARLLGHHVDRRHDEQPRDPRKDRGVDHAQAFRAGDAEPAVAYRHPVSG